MMKPTILLSASLLAATGALLADASSAQAGPCAPQTISFGGGCRNATWIKNNLVSPGLTFLGASSSPDRPLGQGIVVYERVDQSLARAVELSTALPLPAGEHPHPVRAGYNLERVSELRIFEDDDEHLFFQRTDRRPVFLPAEDQWSLVAYDWSAIEVYPDGTGEYTDDGGASQSLAFLGASWAALTGNVSQILLETAGTQQVAGATANPMVGQISVAVVEWIPTPWDCPPPFMYDCNIVTMLVQDGGYLTDEGEVVVEAHEEAEILCGCWNGNDYLIGSGWL
jgi:hypothetical protein